MVDITCLRTGEGWLYLCAVLDLYSGKVVGWSMASVQDRHLVLKAVMMACWQRQDRREVMLHSDRGARFTNAEYQQFLKDHRIVSSMSDVGHCGERAAYPWGTTRRRKASSATSNASGSTGGAT